MKKIPRISIALLLIFQLQIIAYGQKDTINLLTLKDQTDYYEFNEIVSKKPVSLHQEILYNEPGVIDEEFWYEMRFTFNNDSLPLIQSVINLETDTSIMDFRFEICSVWNWEGSDKDTNYYVSGEIEILSWNKKTITLRENIIVHDKRKNKTWKLVGIRTFIKKKKGIFGLWR